ncbi:MAG TPA: radical SAM family heme chaperone HemW [Lacipirellulaceae bacterium]|nr:radical SAM family heme chaperone HemW [Lacipirellulaceae bacterium]
MTALLQPEISYTALVVPRAAYIHVPFCRHRCGYCNFTLVAGRDDLVGDYLKAIAIELAGRAATAHQQLVKELDPRSVGSADPTQHEVDTVYFGGGTPTYLDDRQFRTLANSVLQRHPLAGDYEWTVEANPADIDARLIETLSELGVNRLSLGGQSFRAEKLRLLERDHTAADIEQAFLLARRENMQIALDLIFAAPEETLEQWSADLDAAVALKPDHVSTYGLTFERGTEFWSRRRRGELLEADEDLQRDMYASAIDRLAAAGYEHYEVSNFARPGCRSRHNQVYWSGDGYFAYGPGAARYIHGVRETNHRSTTTYLQRVLSGHSPVAERETLLPEARARELLVFSLRRMEGVSRPQFRNCTGLEIDDLIALQLRKFTDLELLADNGDRIRLTRKGLYVSVAIWPELL